MPAHRRRRSLWCREHQNWRDSECGRVLFTDESRFSLSSDSHRILIWRERGSRNHPSNIHKRDRYGGRGVLLWGGIMLGSRTDFHIFDAGSVNGTRYCYEILLPYVRLFRGAMGLQFLFMDDNAPCHRTVAAEQLLESEDIEHMDWPTRSPDLNPIEHVWEFLGRRLAARTLPPVTIRELRLALQDEWAAMHQQQLIDTLILSMGRRCEICLAVSDYGELWTLSDSRSSLQHLHNWTQVGDKTSISILHNLKLISKHHDVHFQWIPSHVDIFGNEQADRLAREGCSLLTTSSPAITYSELQSKINRASKTAISRLASGHTKSLSFFEGRKTFKFCSKCKVQQASAEHILDCLGLSREDLYDSPLLVIDFLRVNNLMDLV
ncbi:transposable element Tcb2 transposase [Trichonephila clavipes]|nr:transposable element Tcb2 transposase [Trichonephila clavipes]